MNKIQLSNYIRLTITMISKQKLIVNVSHLITNEIFTNTKYTILYLQHTASDHIILNFFFFFLVVSITFHCVTLDKWRSSIHTRRMRLQGTCMFCQLHFKWKELQALGEI